MRYLAAAFDILDNVINHLIGDIVEGVREAFAPSTADRKL